MLSNSEIEKLIENGELVIDPYTPKLMRANGLVLHLGSQLLKPLPEKVVDLKNGVIPDYETINISTEKPFPLEPGMFVIGHTYQKVSIGPTVGFLIEGRSTLARVGLTIVQTAMLVYSGHRDRSVTLELANHGPNTILLYHKMKIAHVALFSMNSPSTISYDDKGKYREQKGVGKPIFLDEILED